MIRSSMDIGSNTVRVLVAEKNGVGMSRLAIKRRITRLGGKFNGKLDPDSVSRTIDTVREFSSFAASMGAQMVRAGCTGVVRKATDSGAFLDTLRRITGMEPVLLKGEEEAHLAALGTRHRLGGAVPEFLLIDIGGFSTELVAVGATVGRYKSHDIGVVSLTEGILRSDPPAPEQVDALRKIVAEELRGFFDEPVSGPLVGIAGTPSTIASMHLSLDAFDPEKVDRHVVPKKELDAMLVRLLGMKSNDRLTSFKGLEKGREDLIPAGIVILQEVMKAGRFEHFMFSLGSLLDGILLSETWPPVFSDAGRPK
jgi:exopolyphosphatase / guanosine-5'-triphosphate,3'-diphosphate pyrophosphatase